MDTEATEMHNYVDRRGRRRMMEIATPETWQRLRTMGMTQEGKRDYGDAGR